MEWSQWKEFVNKFANSNYSIFVELKANYGNILNDSIEYADDPDVYSKYLNRRPGVGGQGDEGYDKKLESFCEIISNNIFYWLEDRGYMPGERIKLIRGTHPNSVSINGDSSHVWVEFLADDGLWYIIDGSAGQFGSREPRLRIVEKRTASDYTNGSEDSSIWS
jgi:hypothetical protein